MGKTGKERKRRRLLQTKPEHVLTDHEDENRVLEYGGIISAEDMNTTLRCLTTLKDHSDLVRSKEFKALRAVVHLVHDSAFAVTGKGATLSGRISDALTDGRWADALAALAEMRSKGQVPKLGALQRWVRDCDAASLRDGSHGDPQIFRVLDSILRTADPNLIPSHDSDHHPVRQIGSWSAFPRASPLQMVYDTILAGNLFTEEQAENYRKSFRVVCHEKGSERRTPNEYDFMLYASVPGTIKTSEPNMHPTVERIDVPNVPGAFMITNVLTSSECDQVLSAAESIGFTPDVPAVGAAVDSVSVLAHNFFWLVDDDFLGTIFKRCEPHFPKEIGGGAVVGVNSRWRVYRYVPGAIYRPHIDGAWPGSGLDPEDGTYKYDMYNNTRWSRLTFLLYLNEEFEGGPTTFFLPAAQEGILEARAVSPRRGCVLCFPHGNTAGSLLHEGSPVLNGAKYVARTDVLYMCNPPKE
ncbi:hypothetical protein INT44_005108 [Umbelopsis vinacea]|uniref:Fe2OG dioxygenase domain-containing protein n=1 Tax=Umbelopsis vinacea TaxID=44442 RepID=A0A8H7Q8B9_9FUNG|nr:hypothetical protein INT44_005108 [Umbelopsis vinacea]